MQRFKSSEQAQDFLSAHSFIYGHFIPADIDLKRIPIPSKAMLRLSATLSQENRATWLSSCETSQIAKSWKKSFTPWR